MRSFLRIFSLILLALCAHFSMAQVRLIQYTDAHSTIETLPQQLKAIDLACREFKRQNPKGECVVFIIGDHTSLHPLSQDDLGYTSIRALKILRDRGHTVVFTPGNHDAFDWSDQVDGAELFINQMKELHKMGVILLGANFVGLKDPLNKFFQEYYELRTLRSRTALVGLTIPQLKRKSNLYQKTAQKIFDGVESYEETFKRLWPKLAEEDYESVILGVHQGYNRLRAQLGKIQKINDENSLNLKLPLLMAAHDHFIAAFQERGTLISDAGWKGSFNVIDIDRMGQIKTPIHHVFLPHHDLLNINDDAFKLARLHENSLTVADLDSDPAFQKLYESIQSQTKQKLAVLKKPILRIKGLHYHMDDLKAGPNSLGHLLSEALTLWSESDETSQSDIPVLAMTNSSSYRYSEPLHPGPINEYIIRSMYPFLAHAKLFEVTGEQATELFFSLRNFFSQGELTKYTPHLSYQFRESDQKLQYLKKDKWVDLPKNEKVRVAIDGWLAEHFRGEGYQIKAWLEILPSAKVIKSNPYQDVLVGYLPPVLQRFDQGRYKSRHCSRLLSND